MKLGDIEGMPHRKKEVEIMKNLIIVFAMFLAMGTQAIAQENLKPAPIFGNLLSGISLDENGRFKPPVMYAYFMKGEKGALKIAHNGNEIAEYSFRIFPRDPPKFEIDRYKLVTGKNDLLGLKLKEAGEYELSYYADGQLFYKFTFELVAKSSGDIYKTQRLLLINGDWNNKTYLLRTSAESHGKWDFKVYVRSDDGKYHQSKSYLRLIRDADKKLVAVGRANFRRERSWTRQTLTLNKPGKKNANNEYYNNQDLLASRDKFTDGGYTLNFYMDKGLYGSYKFFVKDGEIQPQGRQIRESTDPLVFIEGGGEAFWMEKQ